MPPRRYSTATLRHRLQQAGTRFLLSIAVGCAAVLLKVSAVHAGTMTAADIGGRWTMADIPGANDLFTVKASVQPGQVVMTLPEKQIHLSAGQDVVLTPCGAQVYCSAKDFSPAVRFELISQNKADLSIKSGDSGGYAYLDVPLRRDAGD